LYSSKSLNFLFVSPTTPELGRSEDYIIFIIIFLNRHEQHDIIHNRMDTPAFLGNHTGLQSLQEPRPMVQHGCTLPSQPEQHTRLQTPMRQTKPYLVISAKEIQLY